MEYALSQWRPDDLAHAQDPGVPNDPKHPGVPKDPHPFVNNIDSSDPLVAVIARGAQSRIADFLASSGTAAVIYPDPSLFFDTFDRLTPGTLPEGLNYIT